MKDVEPFFESMGVRVRDQKRERQGRVSLVAIVAMLAAISALACGGRTISPPPPDPDPLDRTTYVIGIQDVLTISVWKLPSETASSRFRVSVQGTYPTGYFMPRPS